MHFGLINQWERGNIASHTRCQSAWIHYGWADSALQCQFSSQYIPEQLFFKGLINYALLHSRPLPINDIGKKHNIRQRFFPDSIERIPQCKADKSVPSLDSVLHTTETSSHNHSKLLQILDHQMNFEEELVNKVKIHITLNLKYFLTWTLKK